jgi:hypothetical protein
MRYILHDERSYLKHNKLLVAILLEKHGEGTFNEEPLTWKILNFCYDCSAS